MSAQSTAIEGMICRTGRLFSFEPFTDYICILRMILIIFSKQGSFFCDCGAGGCAALKATTYHNSAVSAARGRTAPAVLTVGFLHSFRYLDSCLHWSCGRQHRFASLTCSLIRFQLRYYLGQPCDEHIGPFRWRLSPKALDTAVDPLFRFFVHRSSGLLQRLALHT